MARDQKVDSENRKINECLRNKSEGINAFDVNVYLSRSTSFRCGWHCSQTRGFKGLAPFWKSLVRESNLLSQHGAKREQTFSLYYLCIDEAQILFLGNLSHYYVQIVSACVEDHFYRSTISPSQSHPIQQIPLASCGFLVLP